ncbi:MAG: FAD-dependent oxidoreductase [Nitrospirae bacterium]|nr:FAD-dependent oxidoreductase [Nitrospirota bacterium]
MVPLYDVIIIGGGPAGLSAAQYASRYGLKTIVLDKSPKAGALAYSSKIENYPGLIEPLSGSELLSIFRKQAIKFGAEYREAQVTGVRFEGDIKEVDINDNTYRGKTVIIATGSMGRKPSIPGEEQFLGRGVSYCAICDAAFFRNLTACVIGDSEEAVKQAELLAGFAKAVYLISPSEDIKVPADHPVRSSGRIKVLASRKVTSIEGGSIVTSIKTRNTRTDEEQDLAVDGVFVYLYGSQPVVDFLNSAMPLSDKSCIMTHRTMETSIPGVFAAGDVTCGETRQVVTAAAYGCLAALSAEKYIHQRKRMRYDWGES